MYFIPFKVDMTSNDDSNKKNFEMQIWFRKNLENLESREKNEIGLPFPQFIPYINVIIQSHNLFYAYINTITR